MFDSIVSKIATVIRNTLRSVREVIYRRPWLAPAAILALLLVW